MYHYAQAALARRRYDMPVLQTRRKGSNNFFISKHFFDFFSKIYVGVHFFLLPL